MFSSCFTPCFIALLSEQTTEEGGRLKSSAGKAAGTVFTEALLCLLAREFLHTSSSSSLFPIQTSLAPRPPVVDNAPLFPLKLCQRLRVRLALR